MKTAIVAGLNEQESDEMRQAFAHAAYLRQRINAILQKKIDASNKVTRSKDAYGIANWAYLQADAVGYERGLQEVISLLTAGEEALTPTIQGPHPKDTPQVPRRGRPRKST